MDPLAEEQLDYEDDEYSGGAQKMQYQGAGAIPALADDDVMVEDEEYDDLYSDVNVGEGFLQFQRAEAPVPPISTSNGGPQAQKLDVLAPKLEPGVSQVPNIPGVSQEGKHSDAEDHKSRVMPARGLEVGSVDVPDGASVSQKGRVLGMTAHDAQLQNTGNYVSVPTHQKIGIGPTNVPMPLPNTGAAGPRVIPQLPNNQTGANVSVNRPLASENPTHPGGSVENGATMLYVGELHWWTTDAELESVLSQYGRVKEIKFFDERASGKSKGYCQVEFYDPASAAACKEGMNGYLFNGRACVVAFVSPQTLKQMGASYSNKSQGQGQPQPQGRRPMNDGAGRGGTNFQGGDSGRNYGRGGWGRGGQGILNRGPGGGGPRGRGAMGGKNNFGVGNGAGGGAYGPSFGGPTGGMMHPQGMMGGGFDPTYMVRGGGGYGGFSGPAFPGMLPSFPGVNAMGLAGVAPHVNPAFFGRGMAANGMGMMGSTGMDVHQAGMWAETSMGGWGGEENGRRTRESSYGGDDGASEYGYGEVNPDKGVRSHAASRERDWGSERDWSGNSERRHRDDKEQDRERSDRDYRYKDDRDGYRDHRHRERDVGNENDWDRGQSTSKSRSRSRPAAEEDHRSRSRDVDYGKRRRLLSE